MTTLGGKAMQDYLLVWRFLPRLAVGGVFMVEVCSALFGLDRSADMLRALVAIVANLRSELALVVIVLLAVVTAANLGSMLLSCLTTAVRSLVVGGIYALLRDRIRHNSPLLDLISPMPDLVRRIYMKHKAFYIDHFRLKSMADEKLAEKEFINSHFREVERLLDSVSNWSIVCAQSYAQSMSQDQRKIEIMEDDLALAGNLQGELVIAAFLIPFRIRPLLSALPLVATAFALACAVIPSQLARKRFLAQFQAASYIDVFTVTKLSEYHEREGEMRP